MTKLSSRSVIIEYVWQKTRLWRENAGYRFDYCTDKECKYIDEHEYAFDGQFFYKKVVK